MEKIVEQILQGKYDYENSSLDFSCAKIEIRMRKGEVCEGSFLVECPANCYVEGRVLSSDIRMECLTRDFTGNGEEIFYRFHAETMSEGDIAKGNFQVISNQGEYFLPFVVTIEHELPDSSVGTVRNLFHFANLAKTDWEEALKLFYSDRFERLLTGGDRQYLGAYRGLSAHPGNEQNLDEFLVLINKKQRIRYLVREEKIEEQADRDSYEPLEISLDITKNGWGYTALQVECEGEFLFTEKEILRETDFLGNRFTLTVFVDTQVCREGNNYGNIYLYNSHTSITVPVSIRIGEPSKEREVRAGQKQKIVQLVKSYERFRLKKIASGPWLKETKEIVESLVAENENDTAARLFQAQLLISEERYNEAGWILDRAANLLEDDPDSSDTLYAYYLYLTTLIRREEAYVNEISSHVEHLYNRDPQDWRIAWLLLYLSEEYNRTAGAKWDFLVKQLHAGCASPILYIEGLHLLNANPTLLRRLDAEELQILHYGAKKEAIGKELRDQIIYLAGRNKEYCALLSALMQKMYESSPDERILQEICSLLVRGNLFGYKYLKWYAAGVEAQLRITNLYEYYMMSLDLDEPVTLPKIVLMYFSYQTNLDLKHSAFLYWYVAQHKIQLGELYEIYRPRMEHFIVDQIQKERTGRHLAGLYQMLLSSAMIDEQTAAPMAKLLFSNRVCVNDLRLKKVIVIQPENLSEREYALYDGKAYVPIYGSDSVLLFEDAYGSRFIADVEYSLEKLMIPGKFMRMLQGMELNNPDLDLYLEEHATDSDELGQEKLARAKRLCDNPSVSEKLRRKLYLRLLKYYYDCDDEQALENYLGTLPMEIFSVEERAEILRYMVIRGNREDAWDYLMQYGPVGMEQKTLLRLISDRIEKDGGEDEALMPLALYTFRQGKYDSRLIRYLAENADCTTKELRDIWKAARSFELDCYALSERILLQSLFSGAFVGEKMQIFEYYVSQGADERLEQAFLARCSYDYFVKERLTERIVFDEIARLADRQEENMKICKLALLKYYAENPSDVTAEAEPVIGEFLQEMLEEKIHLGFFFQYVGKQYVKEPLFREIMDKTIVEYHSTPGAKAAIHYIILHEDGESSEYVTEGMREVCGGYCFKEFVLFFGESLQYYITEERDGEEQLTESGNLQKSDMRGNSADWRYEIINDILISRTLEDYDTLDDLMDEYHRREYLGEHLFSLL